MNMFPKFNIILKKGKFSPSDNVLFTNTVSLMDYNNENINICREAIWHN